MTGVVLTAVMKYIVCSAQRWFQYQSSSAVSQALWRLMEGSVTERGLIMYVTCLAAKLLAASAAVPRA